MAVSAQVMSMSSCNLHPRYVTLPVLVSLMDAAACEGGLGADGALTSCGWEWKPWQLPDCRDQLRVESDHNQKILYNSMDPVCLSFDIGWFIQLTWTSGQNEVILGQKPRTNDSHIQNPKALLWSGSRVWQIQENCKKVQFQCLGSYMFCREMDEKNVANCEGFTFRQFLKSIVNNASQGRTRLRLYTIIYYVKVLFRKFDCTESIALHDQDLFHQHSDLVSDCRAVKHCEAI